MNKQNRIMERAEYAGPAKLLIIMASIGHLIFAGIHVNALLLLENEICGFMMFLFVLVGLVALFEATRIREGQSLEKIFTIALCILTCILGIYLIFIYREAIAVQRALEVSVVNRAVIFSMVLVVVYGVAGILLTLDLVRNRG